jgi:hypothetical protein
MCIWEDRADRFVDELINTKKMENKSYGINKRISSRKQLLRSKSIRRSRVLERTNNGQM